MAMVFALLLVKKALVETNRFFPLPISLISNESSFPSSETIIAFLFMKQPTLNKKKPIKANNDIKLLRCVSKSAPASIRIATKDTTLLAFTAVAAGPEFEIQSRNAMGQPCFASPAISEGVIYLRTTGNLLAVHSPEE